jgi:ubiquinone/menaquinone biosynthesis C-methylase UbiE
LGKSFQENPAVAFFVYLVGTLRSPRIYTTLRDVTVVAGVADRLPVEDESVDAVVYSLVLCSVPDLASALREGQRVLKPGGQLRYLEHVVSESAGLRRTQKVLDATVWPTLGAGCHCARDASAAIESAGFTIEDLERMRFPEMRFALPTSPHILGRARRR